MSIDIEELRREKERLERERQEVERKLAEAERVEREAKAASLIAELHEYTQKIDLMKKERQELLLRIRDAAPRIGDFSYASDDWKLTLHAAREGLKQPALLDTLLAAFEANNIQVEPRNTKFRLVRGLRPIGLLHVSGRRITVVANEPILDPEIIDAAQALAAQYPGMCAVEMASVERKKRVRESVPVRRPDGDYAISISFFALDTGSLDAVLPLALRALDHVAAYWERYQPDDELRFFEPIPEGSAPLAESSGTGE